MTTTPTATTRRLATVETTVQLPAGQLVRASFKVISNKYLLKADR